MLLLRLSLPPPSPPLLRSRFPSFSLSSAFFLPLRFPLPISALPYSSLSPGPTSPSSFNNEQENDTDEIGRLIELLPGEMRRRLEAHPEIAELIEIVMDLGRRPVARFPSGDVFLSDRPISAQDLLEATSQVSDFGADNRAGISRTLHRISAIRNRKGNIIGLTCRVGRAVTGSANLLRDLVKDGGSLLLIGPPGVGKTTIIREMARTLADDHKKRVMIVDTSNEIGGDGDIPHPGIGGARRLQVPNSDMQHKVLIEAVENHMPQVIVIDEIGTKLEAMAASTIAQRGIQLVATAHGVTIENLIMNPSLEMLVGGIQSVTLGDEEATRRGVQKTVLERRGPPTFTCGAEIISKTELRVHRSLESTVDALLAGRTPNYEVIKLGLDGLVTQIPMERKQWDNISPKERETLRKMDDAFNVHFNPERKRERFALYAYGITETSGSQAIIQLDLDDIIRLTDDISEANAVIGLSSKIKKNSQIQEFANSQGIPIYVTKTNSLVQVTKAIRALVNEHMNLSITLEGKEKARASEKTDALEEARLAIEQTVILRGESVQLLPRPPSIISAQIDLIESFRLKWEIVGRDPHASLRILPLQASTEEIRDADEFRMGFNNLSDSDDNDTSISQTGAARLPILPE